MLGGTAAFVGFQTIAPLRVIFSGGKRSVAIQRRENCWSAALRPAVGIAKLQWAAPPA